jgi:hypothetical protein
LERIQLIISNLSNESLPFRAIVVDKEANDVVSVCKAVFLHTMKALGGEAL